MTPKPLHELHAKATDGIQARVNDWCIWFDLPPVKLSQRSNADRFTDWCRASVAPIAWIAEGDARAMAVAYRKNETQTQDFAETVRRLDETETRLLHFGILATIKGDLPVSDIMAQTRAALDAHRKATAKARAEATA